jgi:thiol-disulfide isomerase/thioredoxin
VRKLMLGLAGAFLLSIAASAALAAGPEWIREDEPAALAKAQAEDKLVLVDIWASWCHWCTKLDEDVFTSPEFAEAAKDFVLLKIDSDAHPGVLEKTGQEGLPTTAFMLPDGTLLGSKAGYMPAAEYVKMMGEAKALRKVVGVEATTLPVGDALAAVSAWMSFSNPDQAQAILSAVEARKDLTEEQSRTLDLFYVSQALSKKDFAAANEAFERRIAPEATLADLTDHSDAVMKLLVQAICMLWLDVSDSGELLTVELEGKTGAMMIPESAAGRSAFIERTSVLRERPDIATCTPEQAAAIGHSLCQFLLVDAAMPYLDKGGDLSASDRVGVLLVNDKYAEALEAADQALAKEGLTPTAKSLLLAAKTLALASLKRTDDASATRDLLMATEGLDEAAKGVWTQFLSDEYLGQF